MVEQIGIFPTPLLAPFMTVYRPVRSLFVRPFQTFRLKRFFTAYPAIPHVLDPFAQAPS